MLASLVGGIAAASFSVYAAREGIRITGKQLERYIGQPPLIRETSRRAIPLPSLTQSSANTSLQNLKLVPSLHNQLSSLASFTASAKDHGSAFRHMLFYGSPGTGKTMAAREFATQTGMDYAILSGGDIAPLGNEAVTKIYEVFNWAKSSRKGVVLFIDEAEAFLSSRGDDQSMSEGKRAALNTLLSQTGRYVHAISHNYIPMHTNKLAFSNCTQNLLISFTFVSAISATNNYCIILATNRPEDLDVAIVDRIDEALEFPLPGEKEREAIIVQQLDQQARGVTKSGIFVKQPTQLVLGENVDDAVANAAKATKGFSGRQLEKFVSGVRAKALSEGTMKIEASTINAVLATKLEDFKGREAFKK